MLNIVLKKYKNPKKSPFKKKLLPGLVDLYCLYMISMSVKVCADSEQQTYIKGRQTRLEQKESGIV